MNAILNKNQAECSGSTIYTTLYPCNECAKLIIQSGIENVIYAQVKKILYPPSKLILEKDERKSSFYNVRTIIESGRYKYPSL